MKSIGYGSKIENPDSLRGVVERLPFDLRKRWRSTADKITEGEDREIRFDDIVAFVEKEARTSSHPVFGDILRSKDQEKEKKWAHNSKFKNNNFATRVGDDNQAKGNGNSRNLTPRRTGAPSKNCVMCKQDHKLEDCPEFKRKSYDDRVQFAWSNYLCYNCLTPDHRVRECKRRNTCKDCGRKHSSLLHPPPPVRMNETQSQPAASEDCSNPPVLGHQGVVTPVSNGFVGFAGSTNSVIGFPIIPIKVKARGHLGYVVTHAFLDSGSNSTFCTEELLRQLNLEGEETSLSLSTIEKENSRLECRVVSLEACDLEENAFVDLPTVFSTPILPVSPEDIPRQDDIERWPHLHGICLPQVDAQVGLLIGNDNARALEPIEIRQSRGEGPYAVRTVFGWTVNGPLGRESDGASRTANLIKGDIQLEKQFKKFCEQEFSDSIVDATAQMSREDLKAIEIMEQTTVLNVNHYQMELPWKSQQPSLPNNRALAEHRLKLLKKRLCRDPDLFGKYSSVIDDYLHKGYCERVPDSSLSRADGMVWYLPHHPVLHPAKPEKTRVVFDCAAKYANTSLNDLLLQGPDFNNSLVGVLLRFRQERIALMSDVESMFHQVQVTPDHCDSLRFLWWPENDMNKEPQDFRMKVHLFGAVSSPSCAGFALRKTAKDNSATFPPDVVETVNKNFYVDDCLKSVESESMAIKLVPKLSELLMKGGFHLTKWLCNSPKVLATIPASERASSVKELDCEDMPTERALGVRWNLESDTFGFKVKLKDKPPTRRGMLSIVSSVYDPFGFVSPFVLPAKAVLQDLCRRGLSWDEAIPEESLKCWKEWLFELPRLEEFSIDRCVKPYGFGKISTCQLHHFSDASQIGYGAVTYLRLVDEGSQVHCALLMAKSRLAPLKSISIPRLELSAATVAVRLDKMIRRELELSVDESVFWTDSTSVLKYIANSNTRFHTFVANRVSQILDGSTPVQWRHVPTKLNPADDASRGLKVEALLTATRWKMGPSFLWEQKDKWPNQSSVEKISSDDPEVKKTTSVGAVHAKEATVKIDEVFNRFSSWHDLKKFVAWILRFKTNLRKACRQAFREPVKQKGSQPIQPISTIEMKDAEQSIIKCVQEGHFKEEIESLKVTKNNEEGTSSGPRPSCVKKSSSVFSLDPVLIDGVLRVGGRLRRASLPQDAKHQIILPKNHHVTNLIVRHYHLVSGHSGREYVLSLLRGKFWVIHANSVVRKLLTKCFDCRRRQAPVCNQKMADLPEERVSPGQPPFSHVGIDFFGPFLVKQGRSEVKRYGCIFTCLNIRAVHIEVAHSLDTDSFLNALRRFIARRGKPVLVRTDNGSNFVSGDKEIRANILQWNTQRIHEYLLQQDVRWMFNPPSGSHHGGIWERCIRTTRKILNALLKEQILSDESLMTLLCEVESIINGRPITKVSQDPRDLEALTPNHLLLLRSGSVFPPGIFRKEDTFSRKRWRQVQYLADQFWRRWSREYIPLLQQRQKWNFPRRNLAVDDIVLIVDDNSPRSCWPMARVIEVMPGRDGCVRRVKVKTKTSELERPIDKCVLLEAVEECGL